MASEQAVLVICIEDGAGAHVVRVRPVIWKVNSNWLRQDGPINEDDDGDVVKAGTDLDQGEEGELQEEE